MAAYRKLNYFVPFASNTIDDFTGFKVKSTDVIRQWDGLIGIPEAVSERQPQDFAPNIIPTMVFPNTRFPYPPAPEPERCPPDPVEGNLLRSTEDFDSPVWTGTAGVAGQFDNILNFPTVGDYLAQTYTVTIDPGIPYLAVFMMSGYGTISIGVTSPDESEGTYQQVTLTADDTTEYYVAHSFSTSQTGVRVVIERRTGDTAIQATITVNDCDSDNPFIDPEIV